MMIFGNNFLCGQTIIAFLLLPLVYCKVPDRYVAKDFYLKDGPRIIKGNKAKPGQFPYQVSLRIPQPNDQEIHICGGIIMSNIWVLTAAHCIEPVKCFIAILFMKLVAGETQLLHSSRVKHVRELDRVKYSCLIHPDYEKIKSRRHLTDIALLRVKKKWTFDYYVKPIKRLYYSLPVNTTCTVSGFGLDETGKSPTHLRYTKAYLFDNEFCNKLVWEKLVKNKTQNYNETEKFFTKEILCAGNLRQITRPCSGDSGGPLVCDNHLAGVVVGTIDLDKKKPCLSKGMPEVYTSVRHYTSWILAQYKANRIIDDFNSKKRRRNAVKTSKAHTMHEPFKNFWLIVNSMYILYCAYVWYP